MKSLRTTTLMLLLGAFSICVVPAHAQQEVDPDHFDQPSVASAQVRRAKMQRHLSATATQQRNNKKLAGGTSQKSGLQKNARQTTGNRDVVAD